MRKFFLGLTMVSVMLAGCDLHKSEKSQDSKKDTSIVVQGSPSYKYKRPANADKKNNYISENVNNPLDLKELHFGLMELSKDYFDVDNYYFHEGQYLKESELNKLLGRQSADNPKGLNTEMKAKKDSFEAEKKYPKVLSDIIEEDFVDQKGKIKGISFSIVLNKVDYIRFIDSSGLTHRAQVKIDPDETDKKDVVKEKGEKIAENFISMIRNEKTVPNVPIMVGLYEQNESSSPVPGRYLEKTYVDAGANGISDWEKVDRKYVLIPSGELEKMDKRTSDVLGYFKDDLQKRFPSLGLTFIGKALFVKQNLTDLDLKIEAPVLNEPQAVAISQYIGSQIRSEVIPNYVPISINIMARNEPSAVMDWDPTQKDFKVHIYQK
ncbi:CamS family sex pheromone protein [Falsibacillus albus]|uniref:CamS family sex pheromone protein n=1 Tax=Falsibacillus albus TaxID=2478915 RepID=A0A3L7JXE2_9BACI|nr:CamS family sex pheromone protein [Falsibacillus albus]RLQ94331.1 hypothetical protein D9X91_14855 [Falsibacillus albus]